MMKNKSLILFLILLTSSSYAQDCSGMKDNEEYRLDAIGGPLYQSRIQDQDGLGTCYANATSVALQTALPGNPDVSYLQLAFSYGEKEIAPQNTAKGKDSAFKIGDDDKRGSVLIYGGRVCDTINAVKDRKIGGVCLRQDVALEKTIFDSNTNHSKDALSIQKSVINAISEYYDSTKKDFGTGAGVKSGEIANRTMAFNDYKKSFDEVIKQKQEAFTKEMCLKPDTTNAQTVVKNMIARVYSYLANKYGKADSTEIYSSPKGVPDANLFFYYSGLGTAYKWSGGDELELSVSRRVKSALESNYIASLNSSTPPKDALSVLRNTLINFMEKEKVKSNTVIVDKLLKDLSLEDKELLNKDYNRYVKKDVSDCVDKNSLAYFKDDQGLVKDFEQNQCLKLYLNQGKNLKNLAAALDQYNFNNIAALNAFMTRLPSMSYEQAMRAIVAPDCSQDKKIKIPDSVTCESNNFDYISSLKTKMAAEGKSTFEAINRRIKTEEINELAQVDVENIQRLRAIETEYANKKDAASLKIKEDLLKEIADDKIRKRNKVNETVGARVTRELAGDKESQYWNEYITSNKRKFNADAVSLLKNQKQAVPISVCTRMFTAPSASSLRDGICEKSSSDNNYTDVGGHHAVTVIGARCQKGKVNYLIQNSWGDWSSIKKTRNADGTQHYQSEFGKAWMNEDELMNNTFGYQKISK